VNELRARATLELEVARGYDILGFGGFMGLRFVVATLCSLASLPAFAGHDSLDPLNRAHLGVSYSDQNTLGINGGFDSRLTRLVFIDMGGFASPMPFPDDIQAQADDPASETVFLRHGIYVAPGIRVPHREKDGLQWDVTGRGGFGGVWSADINPESVTMNGHYEVEADPALLAGLDLQLRKDHVGLRVTGKEYFFKVFSGPLRTDVALAKPQFTGEVVYQW
jgi:hypothetical protein